MRVMELALLLTTCSNNLRVHEHQDKVDDLATLLLVVLQIAQHQVQKRVSDTPVFKKVQLGFEVVAVDFDDCELEAVHEEDLRQVTCQVHELRKAQKGKVRIEFFQKEDFVIRLVVVFCILVDFTLV